MTGPLYFKNEECLTHPTGARLKLFLRFLDLLCLLHDK
jgi:hypothetical protein